MAEIVKKSKTAAKPRKPATKKTADATGADPVMENHQAKAQGRSVSHDEVARLAHSYWQVRGHKHGHHMDDWFRAEQDLLRKAS